MQRGNIKFPSLRSVVPAIFAVFKKRPHGGENRLQVLADYYRTSTDFIAQVQNFSPDKDTRRDNAKAHGINPHILRTMLDYTRYPEAEMLLEALATVGVGPKELRVLDFGCLVADYGITFARRKARVTIYDYQEPTDFAKFRFAREHLPVEVLHVPDDYPRALTNKDLVIFGEVLEHLENPLQVGRYHSLAGLKIPEELEISARSESDVVMGVRHKKFFVEGVQFHPESILTPSGGLIIENLLAMIK